MYIMLIYIEMYVKKCLVYVISVNIVRDNGPQLIKSIFTDERCMCTVEKWVLERRCSPGVSRKYVKIGVVLKLGKQWVWEICVSALKTVRLLHQLSLMVHGATSRLSSSRFDFLSQSLHYFKYFFHLYTVLSPAYPSTEFPNTLKYLHLFSYSRTCGRPIFIYFQVI